MTMRARSVVPPDLWQAASCGDRPHKGMGRAEGAGFVSWRHGLRRMPRAVTAAAAVVFLVSGCSNDDTGEGAAGSSTTLAVSTEGNLGAFCDALVALDGAAATGGAETSNAPAIDQALRAVESSAPADIRETELRARLSRQAYCGEGEVLEGTIFAESEAGIDQYALANCAVNSVSVTAVDYAYQGVPDSVPPGRTAFSLDNQGTEFHEAALIPINDDAFDGSISELLETYVQEDLSAVATTARIVASPGQSNVAFVDREPGRYGMVCFIPVGSSPDADEREVAANPPHYTEGMVAEFVVE